MDFAAIEHRFQELRNQGRHIEHSSNVSAHVISGLEASLGGWLPASYKEFMSKYGWLENDNIFLSGITDTTNLREGYGSVLFDTEEMRKDENLPMGYVVLESHEDGAYCLDLTSRKENECSVVNFERGWTEGAKVSEDFESWLLDFFLYIEK